MTTNATFKADAVDPWQLRILAGDNAPKVVTEKNVAVPKPASDAETDDRSAGQQPAQFLPRFQPTPDGMEWS